MPADSPSPMTAYATPADAEAAFYAAFEAGDAPAMMAVWAEDDGIQCVHPGGPLLSGRAAIGRSWSAILAEAANIRIRVEPRQQTQDAGLAVRLVYEHIQVGRKPSAAPVVATNIYRDTGRGWRMIAHHASPCPPIERGSNTPLH